MNSLPKDFFTYANTCFTNLEKHLEEQEEEQLKSLSVKGSLHRLGKTVSRVTRTDENPSYLLGLYLRGGLLPRELLSREAPEVP